MNMQYIFVIMHCVHMSNSFHTENEVFKMINTKSSDFCIILKMFKKQKKKENPQIFLKY